MDLPTPPPSYESATGAPGVHNQKNTFLNGPPSAPPLFQQDDEIISEPVTTTPIFPQSYNLTPPPQQYGQPYNQNTHQLVFETSQTNLKLQQERSKAALKCKCYLFGIIMIICVIVIIIGVTTKSTGGRTKKYDISDYSVPDNNVAKEWEEKWWKDNKEYIESLQNQRAG